MVVPPAGKLRIVRSALRDRAAARALGEEIGGPEWAASAQVLKRDDRTSVLAGEAAVDGVRRAVIVKVMRADRFKDRLARWTVGTRLMRQWDGATRLMEEGVASPECFALWRGAGGVECLAMEKIEGRTLLHEMARGRHPVRIQHALAAEAGRLVAELVEGDIYNRDMKPSNVMVRWVADVPSLCVIDPAGIRARRAGSDTAMLAKLIIECLGIGARPRLPLMMRALRACGESLGWNKDKRQRTWKVVEYVVENHGDPRPVVDPMS